MIFDQLEIEQNIFICRKLIINKLFIIYIKFSKYLYYLKWIGMLTKITTM